MVLCQLFNICIKATLWNKIIFFSPIYSELTAKMFVTGVDGIFVADLQDDLNFTSIPSTDRPNYISYDSVEKKIYWGDRGTKLNYRADEDGGNREEITSGNDNGMV